MFQRFTKWVLGIEKEVDRRVQAKLREQQAYLLDQYHQRIETTYMQINRSVGSLHRTINELRAEMAHKQVIPKTLEKDGEF